MLNIEYIKLILFENLYIEEVYRNIVSIAVVITGYMNKRKFFLMSLVALFFLYENNVEIILQTMKYKILQMLPIMISAVILFSSASIGMCKMYDALASTINSELAIIASNIDE